MADFSFFSYNNIVLQLCKTNLLARDVVYSPDGADRWYTKWTIDVECIYSPGATAYTLDKDGNPVVASLPTNAGLATGAWAPTTDLAIREALTEPRRPLVYTVPTANGPVVLLRSPVGQCTVDAHDGPKPIHCHVRQMSGSKTWFINFRIETCVSECDLPDQADPLLSNRYEIAHSVDAQHLTTLTYSGVALFRSDALQFSATGNADHFRDRCLPPVPLGFQRKNIEIRVSSVGNSLMWYVVDHEKIYGTGDKSGVTDFESTYTTEGAASDGSGSPSLYDHATLDCTVLGNKNSTRTALIVFAMRFAIERLGLKARPVLGDDALLKKISIREYSHDMRIDVRIMAQLPPAKAGAMGLGGINGNRLGIDLFASLPNNGLNPQMPNDLNTRGFYTGEAFAAALQAACSKIDPVKYRPGQSFGTSNYPLQDYTPPDVLKVDVGSLPISTRRYSTAQTSQGMYTDYKVEAKWHHRSGRMIMPVAGDDDSKPVVIQSHSPYYMVTYQWEAERVGRKPSIPTTDHNDKRMVYLDSKVGVYEKFPAADGMSPVYRIRGEIHYGYKGSGSTPLQIDIPCAPWTDWRIEDDRFTDQDVAHGIIDPNYPRNAGEDPSPGDPGLPGYPDPTDPGQPTPTPTDPGNPTNPPSPGAPRPGDPPTIDPPTRPPGSVQY